MGSSPVLLVPQVLLDASTTWDGTHILIADFGVGDAEENKGPADCTNIPSSTEHESALLGV